MPRKNRTIFRRTPNSKFNKIFIFQALSNLFVLQTAGEGYNADLSILSKKLKNPKKSDKKFAN